MSLELLKARLEEYTSLQTLVKESPEKVVRHGVITVYLGDNYFVELTPDRAVSFLQRRMDVLQQEITTLQHIQGINEDGLPIMEIVEELDDDDNVVTSRVDRAASALEHLRSAMAEAAESQKSVEPVSRIEAPPRNNEHTPRIVEISESAVEPVPEPVESAPKSDASSPLQQEPQATAGATFNGMSRDDMLELQLVQDELDLDDDDDMEIDLVDLDIDDDEDDDDDDDDGPFRGSLFPQTQRVKEMLAQQFPDAEAERKAVRFADALDVREFETSPSERKGLVQDSQRDDSPTPEEKPKAPKVSQFKLRRSNASVSPVKATPAAEKPRVAESVIETPPSQPTAPDPSKRSFSATQTDEPQTMPVSSQVVEKLPQSNIAEKPLQSQVVETSSSSAGTRAPRPPKSTYSRRYKVPTTRPAAVPIAAPVAPAPDPAYEGLSYIRDEDDESRRDLEDEAMKLFDQSTIPDDQFLELHGDAVAEDSIPQSDMSSAPILSSVAEHDSFDPVDDEALEKHNDMLEIRREYQRLRQRLVHRAGGYGKTDRDMEVEAVDEDGNPVKMSRFKAARIGMR